MHVRKGDIVRLSLPMQQVMYRAGCPHSMECWRVLSTKHEMLKLTPLLSDNYKLAFIRIKAEQGNVTKVTAKD